MGLLFLSHGWILNVEYLQQGVNKISRHCEQHLDGKGCTDMVLAKKCQYTEMSGCHC
jgi:hypothetical protein